jgi:hypothetical protein
MAYLMNRIVLGAAVAAVAWTQTAQAELIAYEGFDYADGTPLVDPDSGVGLNGGTGWAAAWGGAALNTVLSPGFGTTAGSYLTTGNRLDLNGSNSGNLRTLTSSPDSFGSTLYFSFIADIDSGNYAGLSLFEDDTETLFVGKTFDAANWGIDIGGTGVNTTTPTSTQSLLVVRLDFGAATTTNPGDSTLIRMYVNPAVGTEPMLADASITKLNFTFDGIRVQAGSEAVDGAFDEIRLGTTYADVAVVPEPASLGLVAAGGALLLGRRRARKV